jgi:hypothetical protein
MILDASKRTQMEIWDRLSSLYAALASNGPESVATTDEESHVPTRLLVVTFRHRSKMSDDELYGRSCFL